MMSKLSRIWVRMKRIILGGLRTIGVIDNRPAGFNWRKDFIHHFWPSGLLWIVGLAVFVLIIEWLGMLKGFEGYSLDAFLHIHGPTPSEIRIVEISESDYTRPTLFNSQSPLKSCLVSKLIKEIASYSPAVIGVDLDTSDAQWRDVKLNELLSSENCGRNTGQSCIVWAEVPEGEGAEELRFVPVLGGQLDNCIDEHNDNLMGIPRFPIDEDGLVRHYETGPFAVAAKDAGTAPPLCRVETFAHAIVKNFFAVTGNGAGKKSLNGADVKPFADLQAEALQLAIRPKTDVIFNFYGERYRFPKIPAHDFLSPVPFQVRHGRTSVLQGSIVLIGGTFKEARDSYPTPLGLMAGVELNALAIESDLHAGIYEVLWWKRFLADMFLGFCVMVVFFAWPRHPKRVFWWCLGVGFAFSLDFSLILFKRTAYWFSFMPMVIGMVLHEAIEAAQAAQDGQTEVAAGEREISRLETELRRGSKIAFNWQFPRQHYDDAEFEKLLAEASAAQKARGFGGTQLAS